MSFPAAGGAVPRIVLHVGLHKTGTTYLQNVWRANRDNLAAQGIHYPGGPGEPVQRLAAYDLMGKRPRGVDDQRPAGQWQALVDVVAGSKLPTVLVSEEGLGVATPRQAAVCVQGFPGREVHVLVTCRDLGRVLVSAWQEEIKNNQTWTWTEYAAGVRDAERRWQNPARGFWRAQDLPAIVETWRAFVPAARIHLVTVPPSGAPAGILLERIAEVVGFDPAGLTAQAPWDNASLGAAATEAIRLLNVGLDHTLNQRQYGHLVKGVIVPYVVQNGKDERYGLPVEDLGWVEAESRRQVEAIVSGGYSVVGDLDDLLPRASAKGRRPDEFTTAEVEAQLVVALTGLSTKYSALWWRRRKDDQPVVPPASRRVRLLSTARSVAYKSRRAGAGLADRNRYAASALGGYLRVTQRRGSGGALP